MTDEHRPQPFPVHTFGYRIAEVNGIVWGEIIEDGTYVIDGPFQFEDAAEAEDRCADRAHRMATSNIKAVAEREALIAKYDRSLAEAEIRAAAAAVLATLPVVTVEGDEYDPDDSEA